MNKIRKWLGYFVPQSSIDVEPGAEIVPCGQNSQIELPP